MLENDFTIVCGKALRGLHLTRGDLATRAGLMLHEVSDFLQGNFSAELASRIAVALDLNATALMNHPAYLPKPIDMVGIRKLELPFDEDTVNAWIVHQGNQIIVFDAGYDADEWLEAVELNCERMPDGVFITHGDVDHVGGLDILADRGVRVYSPNLAKTISMKPGDEVRCGPLTISACDLSGHFTPQSGFHVKGLPVPILVVGDALFAGSIGRCKTPADYQHALERMRIVFASLPDSTILLPGHGPATTLGEERVSNPFL